MTARAVGPADPSQRIELSLLLRPRHPLSELEPRLGAGIAPPLTREELAARYGADPADVARVEAFAREHGLLMIEASATRRTVRLAGRAGELAGLFGTELIECRADDGAAFRATARPVVVPTQLEDIVHGVFGFDTRRVASPG